MNLRPAPWEQKPTTIEELKEFMKTKEFTVLVPGHYGQTTTIRELKALNVTHAQILYGKNLEKSWYGVIE